MITISDIETIWRLRLLICRAAQPDSMRWWEDRSLIPEGTFVVERLFGVRPRIAAAQIALASARSRHWSAISKADGIVHLFDFGDDVEYELAQSVLEESWVPSEPFASMDGLHLAIERTAPDDTRCKHSEPDGNGAIAIILDRGTNKRLDIIVTQASALASAYNSARPGQPVFPYIRKAR